jgi:hypothetical protein
MSTGDVGRPKATRRTHCAGPGQPADDAHALDIYSLNSLTRPLGGIEADLSPDHHTHPPALSGFLRRDSRGTALSNGLRRLRLTRKGIRGCPAKDYLRTVNVRGAIINGSQLVDSMIERSIGVKVKQRIDSQCIDEDVFIEE